jgi:hypothetical protein
VEQTDAACALWLEFVEETVGERWSDDVFLRAARHLGEFNGGLRDDAPIAPWMSCDWLRANLREIDPLIERFRGAAAHPLYRRAYSPGDHAYILSLWEQRDRFLGTLDNLPQTICHYDAFRRNLLAREHQTVALDWGFLGRGAVGNDLAALLWVSFVFNSLNAAQLHALYPLTFAAYLDGLRAAGWRGDEGAASRGVAAAFTLRVLVSAAYDTLIVLDEANHARFEAITGLSMDVYMRQHVAAAQPIIQQIAGSL